MWNWRTSVPGQPSTCPRIGLQNEPRRSEKWAKIGTTNWTPYLISGYFTVSIILHSYCVTTVTQFCVGRHVIVLRSSQNNLFACPMTKNSHNHNFHSVRMCLCELSICYQKHCFIWATEPLAESSDGVGRFGWVLIFRWVCNSADAICRISNGEFYDCLAL